MSHNFLGLKIWVVTGDKSETAINIGYLSSLLTQDMHIFHLYDEEGGEKEVEDGLLSAVSTDSRLPRKEICHCYRWESIELCAQKISKGVFGVGDWVLFGVDYEGDANSKRRRRWSW